MAGIRGVFQEDGEAIDEKRLRDTIEDGGDEWLEANFVGERATEFDERAAVIEAVAIEKAVEASLNADAQRFDEESGDDNGDDGSGRARGETRTMSHFADDGDDGEVDSDDGRSSESIREAALEDDVYVHQAVADDGVAEAKRNQREREDADFHPRRGHTAEEERHDVEKQEWSDAGEGAAGDPLQLLAKDAARSAEVTRKENTSGEQEVGAEVCQFHLIEPVLRTDGWQEVECAGGDKDVEREQRGGRRIDREELGPKRAATLRKDQRKVDKQRGLQEQSDHVAPVNFPIESVQLSGVVEAVEDERDQAE